MDELIKALQCASHFALYQDCYEKNCYANSGKGLYCNIPKLMADAADALEVAEKRLEELEKQMPKEGAWIDLFGHDYKCSVCGEWYKMDGTPETEDMNYCPNCGARMDGETEHGNTYSLGKIEMPKGAIEQIIADGERKEGAE